MCVWRGKEVLGNVNSWNSLSWKSDIDGRAQSLHKMQGAAWGRESGQSKTGKPRDSQWSHIMISGGREVRNAFNTEIFFIYACIYFFKFLFIERERESGEGQKEKKKEKQTLSWAGSLMCGLIPGPRDQDPSQMWTRNHQTHSGAPLCNFFIFPSWNSVPIKHQLPLPLPQFLVTAVYFMNLLTC